MLSLWGFPGIYTSIQFPKKEVHSLNFNDMFFFYVNGSKIVIASHMNMVKDAAILKMYQA